MSLFVLTQVPQEDVKAEQHASVASFRGTLFLCMCGEDVCLCFVVDVVVFLNNVKRAILCSKM